MSKQMEKETEKGIFLDGREYTASDLYKLIALLVGNGVYANELAPTATNENMSITHGTGHAWIGGVAYVNTTPFVLDIATADGSLNRYDSLMLRLNLSINEVYAVIVQGEYATTPTPPVCTRNAETFDLKICDIYIPAGCTKITQDQITDTRLNSAVCGVPVFPVEHLDMTTFYEQISTDLINFKQKEQTSFADWYKQAQAYVAKQQQDFEDFFTSLTNDLNVLTFIQEYTAAVTLYEDTDSVYIGIDDFVADEDVLFVSVNGFVCASSGYTVNGTGAEAYVVLKESRTTGDTVEFRVLKSKIGSTSLVNTFVLVDVDGTVLTDNGAALVIE